jgi:hypothetical protein
MAPAPETGDRLPAHKWGARPSPKDDRDLLLEKSPALARALIERMNRAAELPPAFAPTGPASAGAVDVTPASGTLAPLPYPYDQDSTPWCMAEAVTGGASYLWHRLHGVPFGTFDQRSVGNLYALAKTIDGDPNGEGTTARAVLYQAQHVGILGVDGKRYRIGAYHSLIPSVSPESLIEQALGVLGQPVVAGVPWPGNWYDELTYPGGLLPSPPDTANSPGGHGIEVFSYVMGHPGVGSPVLALLNCLRNSWGPEWGNGQGNAYAQAADLCRIAFDLWTFGL